MKFRRTELIIGLSCLLIGLFLIIYDFLQNEGSAEVQRPKISLKAEDKKFNFKDFQEKMNGAGAKTSKPQVFITEIIVKQNENFISFLKRHGLSSMESLSILNAIKGYYKSSTLKRGQRFFLKRLKTEGDSTLKLQKVIFLVPPGKKFSILRKPKGDFYLEKAPDILPKKTQFVRGSIQDSLYIDALKRGLSRSTINKLTKIFSYSVDLQRSLHQGDKFEVLVEKTYDQETGFVDPGSVVYAALYLRGGPQKIYRYSIKSDEIDYFDEKGAGVRKALLQTPVKGARLSSGFGKRNHPILGYTKTHKGIDFAAPQGTPILAAGDGLIRKLGWLGGYGNYILVGHNKDYSTAYAHLSAYAKGLKKGIHIKQGQVIGYVGRTGRATGAHLHYEVHYRNQQVNPHKIKMPSQKNLKGDQLRNFLAYKKSRDNEIAAFRAGQ